MRKKETKLLQWNSSSDCWIKVFVAIAIPKEKETATITGYTKHVMNAFIFSCHSVVWKKWHVKWFLLRSTSICMEIRALRFWILAKTMIPIQWFIKWIPSHETMIDKITHKMQRHFYGHFFSGRWIILIFKRNLSPWIHFICVLHALGWWMVINVHELHSVHEHHFFLHSFFSRISQVK